MKKYTKLSIQWFYSLLERGECELMDFKEQLENKEMFGKPMQSFAPNYGEMARDVVAFANHKGGFIIIGVNDKTKELSTGFKLDETKKFELIKNIQDRTRPAITVVPHELKVGQKKVLVIEIPFSNEVFCTSKGEYLVRNFDGNKILEPHELVTVMAEKQQIIYDQKVWKLNFPSTVNDTHGIPVPGWEELPNLRKLWAIIKHENPKSPYLKDNQSEFLETFGLTREVDDQLYPTTTGILFVGNKKALRELPHNYIKYIRYKSDGSYTPYEFRGNLIEIADQCFDQLKSEINMTEFRFGLFRDFVEDYPEVVIRELLINALAHRDYSRQAHIEIRKYEDSLEIESPGGFPDGITVENYLRKSNPRNPNIMDVFRETRYAEKAGSGFDKVFTALLLRGKTLPVAEVSDSRVLIRVFADTFSQQLIQLSHNFKDLKKRDMDLDKLLVLDAICRLKKPHFKDLEDNPHVKKGHLRRILDELLSLEFIETSGKTNDLIYLIHKNKLQSGSEERNYILLKKQEKQKQKESILRYLDSFSEIDNTKARDILMLPDGQVFYVSRLLKEMLKENLIQVKERSGRKSTYVRT